MNQNWTIKKMPEVVKWGSGGTPKATVKEYYENGNIPWLIIGDLNDEIVLKSESKITKLGLENSSAKMLSKGTLLVAMYGSIGKLGITGIECCANQAIAFAKELHGVTTKFMYYQMKLLKPKLISMGKGGTQKNISQTVLNSLDVIVPPIEEQELIVTKIEELFSKLDKGVEELNKIKEQLKIYRQAVLKEAFESNIEYKPLGEISSSRLGKMLDKNKNTGEYRPYLRNINVRWINFDLCELLDMKIEESELEKYTAKKGDLLMCEGGEPGRCAVWNMDYDICYQKAIHRIRFNNNTNPKFYMYYFYYIAQIGELSKYFTGTGIKHLTGESLKKVPVPVLDKDNQQSILKLIEQKLSVCDKIEQTVNESLQKAESFRQSILKQAFEGNLI